jgi:hypothetical protein
MRKFLPKGAIGNATKERNGFVFVKYNNARSQQTKGWINLNDISFSTSTDDHKLQSGDPSFKPTNFKVTVAKAFFYSEPISTSKRYEYLPLNATIHGQKLENGFIYTRFKSSSGNTTVGWLRSSDIEEKP